MFFDQGRDILPCKYVLKKPFGPDAGDLPVFIPDIMKKWGPDTPKFTPVPLQSSCYNNASDCKPVVSKMITTQNFATAKEPVTPWKAPNYTFCDDMEVWPGTNDVLTPRLTTENVDNSW